MKLLVTLLLAAALHATVPAPTYIGSTGFIQINVKISDALGVSDIAWADISVGTPGAGGCIVEWHPGALYLFADNGSTLLGGYAPGSNNTISNSQCVLKVATSSATVIGSDLYLWLDIGFVPGGYVGFKVVYMVSGGSQGHDGWHTGGTILVGQSAVPSVSLNSPASGGNGSSQSFKVQIVDTSGVGDISWLNFSVGVSGANSCTLQWNPGEYIQLFADNGSSVTGGYAGSSGTLQNGQCSVSLAGSSGSTNGPNTKYVTFALTLLPSYSGQKTLYAIAGSPAGNNGWVNIGAWTIPNMNSVGDATLTQTTPTLGVPTTDAYTGLPAYMPTSESPAPAVEMSSPVGNPSTLHPGDSFAVSISWAPPNTQIWMVETDQPDEVDCTNPANAPQCVAYNFSSAVGTTDSTGYLLYAGTVNAVNPVAGLHVMKFFRGAPSSTQPPEQNAIGGVSYWAYSGAGNAPAAPDFSVVKTSAGMKRTPFPALFAVHPPSSSYKQNGPKWEYTFDLDTTKAKLINVGDDQMYAGAADDTNPNLQPQNGFDGMGSGWMANDNSLRSQHSVFKLVSDWLPGPVSVLFSGGVPQLSEGMIMTENSDIRHSSVRKNVLGPAIPPGADAATMAALVRNWVDQGNHFLIPLVVVGLDLKAELAKLKPAEGYEQNVVNCILAALEANQ